MADPTSPERPGPWHTVHGGPPAREAVAPSKPALPTTGSIPVVPQPIEGDDAEVVAPVASPPSEEIMPSTNSALWSSAPPMFDTSAPSPSDPVRDLGSAAVHSASLSASGAPTPLGGIPQVASSPAAAASPDRPAPGPVLPASPVAGIAEFTNDEPAYTPPFGVAMPTTDDAGMSGSARHDASSSTSGSGDDSGAVPPATPPERTPWWRSAPFLVIVGLLVMGAIGYGVYLLVAPDTQTVELTQEVIVAAPAEAALEPITIEDPTEFQSALPTVVGPYALTAITAIEPGEAGLDVRAAEVDDLTYSDGTSEVTVRAIQHYDAEAAAAQFEVLAVEGTDRQPVEAGGTDVGESATVPAESGSSIAWRNGTAVFVATGPADVVDAFFSLYPL